MEIEACRVSPTQMVQTVSVDVGNPDEVEKAMSEAVSRQGTVQARDNGAIAVSALCVFAIAVVGVYTCEAYFSFFLVSRYLGGSVVCLEAFVNQRRNKGSAVFSPLNRSVWGGAPSMVCGAIFCGGWCYALHG